MRTSLLVVALCALVAAAAATAAPGSNFTYSASNGDFTVENVSMTVAGGKGFGPGNTCTVSFSGKISDALDILAGTFQYKIYENFVQHFVQEGNTPYFACNNKGCDRAEPVALTLASDVVNATTFTAKLTFTMPIALKTGQYSMVLWGSNQNHFPYDMSLTLFFKYPSAVMDASIDAQTPALRHAVERGIDNVPGKFTAGVSNGAFDINDVSMTSATGTWTAGTVATVTFTGVANLKVTSGTLRYKIYEDGAQHFLVSGYAPFFKCTNKGCSPNEPVALTLKYPTANRSNFVLSTKFTMPGNSVANFTGPFKFRADFWAETQIHYPAAFDATIDYTLSPSAGAIAAASAPNTVNNGSMIPGEISYTASGGNMTVATVDVLSSNGKFVGGDVVEVQVTGKVLKRLLAGAVQWQLYEEGVRSFLSNGFKNYFACTNKGCNTMQPEALVLASSEVPTTYKLQFKVPLPTPTVTGDYTLVAWGVDQDHFPYDFSMSAKFTVSV